MTNITKKDAANTLADRGIALPDNWSKMSTERALEWAESAMAEAGHPQKPKKAGIVSRGISAVAGAVAAGAAAVTGAATTLVLGDEETRLDRAARKNAAKKVYSDPNYVRTTRKTRRMVAAMATEKFAIDPETPSRQMLRRAEIESKKQPLEMSQEAWHQLNGFGKVQPFGSSIRQTRNKIEKARREQALRAAVMGV